MPTKLDLCIGFSAPEPDLYQNWVLILSTGTASTTSNNSILSTPLESTYYYTLNSQDTHGNRLAAKATFQFQRFVTSATSFPAWPIDKMEKVCSIDAHHKKYVDKAASEGPTQNSQLYIALILERLGNYGVIPGHVADRWGERVDQRLLALAEMASLRGDGTLGLTDEERERRWREYNDNRGVVCRWTFAYLVKRWWWVA
ncbi:hypothetical protein BJX68DRAFT_263989 [Aspergillus pseudodeflectus]|uniref:Ig-like domain-containing protein n=1 Tax=Aspergillus pseudodeflectus TaxID=176178 RepID=A0ABR4KTM2_9EURO